MVCYYLIILRVVIKCEDQKRWPEVERLLNVLGNAYLDDCDNPLIASILPAQKNILSERYICGQGLLGLALKGWGLKRSDVPNDWEWFSFLNRELHFIEIDLFDSEGYYKYGKLVCEIGDKRGLTNCIVVCKLPEGNGQPGTTHTQAFSINERGVFTVYPTVKRAGTRMRRFMELMRI